MTRNHVRQAKTVARRLAAEAPASAREMAATVNQGLEQVGDTVRETAEDVYRRGRDQLSHSTAHLQETIEDQPIRSVLIALGIGCLLGALFVRR